MLVDLTDIIKNINGKCNISESFTMPEMSFLGEDFVFEKPVSVKGSILNNSKALELSLTVSGVLTAHCARCGKPVTENIEFPVFETLMREGSDISDSDDVILYSGKEIELDDIIVENFLLNVPVKYLCRDDCKGLCPVCGIDLNEGSCDCDKDVIDPRLEKLAEIMKNMTDTE